MYFELPIFIYKLFYSQVKISSNLLNATQILSQRAKRAEQADKIQPLSASNNLMHVGEIRVLIFPFPSQRVLDYSINLKMENDEKKFWEIMNARKHISKYVDLFEKNSKLINSSKNEENSRFKIN